MFEAILVGEPLILANSKLLDWFKRKAFADVIFDLEEMELSVKV